MNLQQEDKKIPGYDYGTDKVARSPITLDEWETLKKSALFSEEDVVYLRLSHDVLADQVDDLLNTWRGIIFDHPHLRAYDEDPKPARSTPSTPGPCGNVSASGYSTPRRPSTIRPGSTISTRSACAIIARKKIGLITGIPSGIFAPATCSLSAPRSWFR
jgi:hypothetical protein